METNLAKIQALKADLNIPDNPVVYYPGMGEDIYFPFYLLDAVVVDAVDMCDYWNNYKMPRFTSDKKIKFYGLFHSIMSSIKCLPSEKPWEDMVQHVILDDEQFIFIINFTYLGKPRILRYCYFQRMETYHLPKDYPVDIICAKGARVCFRNFSRIIHQEWSNSGAVFIKSDYSRKIYKDWDKVGRVTILEPLNLKLFYDMDLINRLHMPNKDQESAEIVIEKLKKAYSSETKLAFFRRK